MEVVSEVHHRHRRIDDARCVRDALRYELSFSGEQVHELPDEHELVRRFGCSRNAIREALNLLRNEKLIERRPGSGTRTIGTASPFLATENQGLLHDIIDGPSRVHYRLAESIEVTASLAIARVLGVRVGDPLVVVSRLTIVDDEPVCLWDTFVPEAVGKQLVASTCRGDFFELIRETLGVVVADIQLRVEAVAADPSVSVALQIPVNSPVLRFERVVNDETGEFIALSFGRSRADRVALVLQTHRNDETVRVGCEPARTHEGRRI